MGKLAVNTSKWFWLVLVLAASQAGVSHATLMYYRDSDDDTIKQLDLINGQTTTVASDIGQLNGITVDPIHGNLYWNGGYRMFKLTLDGGSPELFMPPAEGPFQDVAVDPLREQLYWIGTRFDVEGIMRSDSTGGAIEVVVELSASDSGIRQLSLDLVHGRIYWSTSRSIHRADLDGSNQELLVTTDFGSVSMGIAVDPMGGKVYWTRNGSGWVQGEVWRANLDGSDPERLLSDLLFDETKLQVELDFSAGKMYINRDGDFWVQRANCDGTDLETVEWFDHPSIGPIALDSIVVPEPASACSMLVGLALLLARRTCRRLPTPAASAERGPSCPKALCGNCARKRQPNWKTKPMMCR